MAGRSEIVAPEIGERIKTMREALGMSVANLASALGLKPFALREIESGRSMRQYLKLAEMCRMLRTTPNVLLGFEPEAIEGGDQLDMMGAAVQVMLIDEGWPRERAEALVDIATEVALEKTELELDRRLAAAFRKRALHKSP